MNNTSKRIPIHTQMNESPHWRELLKKQRLIIIFGLQHENLLHFCFRSLFELFGARLANVIKNYSVSRTHRLSSNKPIGKKCLFIVFDLSKLHGTWYIQQLTSTSLICPIEWKVCVCWRAHAFNSTALQNNKNIEWMDTPVCHMVAIVKFATFRIIRWKLLTWAVYCLGAIHVSVIKFNKTPDRFKNSS